MFKTLPAKYYQENKKKDNKKKIAKEDIKIFLRKKKEKTATWL